MTRGKDVPPPPPDEVPPANTWAIWAPLTDAGEALYNLAAAAVCPDPPRAEPAHQAQQVHPAQRAQIAQTTNTVSKRADISPPSTPQAPPRPPSPALPPSMASIAATHPYSTAFLLGAAVSASVLAGAAAAKVALRVPPGNGAAAAGAAAGAGAAGARAARPRDSETLARLDALARELHAQRAGMEAIPRLEARLAGFEPGYKERMERLQAAQTAQAEGQREGHKALAAQMGAIRELDKRVGELAGMVRAMREPTPMPELGTLRADVGAAMAHLEALRGELSALSSHFAPARAEMKKVEEKEEAKREEHQSINDLATEGLAGVRSALAGDFKPDGGSAAEQATPASPASPEFPTSQASPDASTKPADAAKAAKASAETSFARPAAEVSTQDKVEPAAEPTTSSPAEPSRSSSTAFLEEDATHTSPSQAGSRVHSPTAGGRPVAHLGVNDSGEWRFRLRVRRPKRPHDGGLRVEQMDVILCRAQRAECPGWYERSATYTVGPLTATVLVAGDGDVDMIMLDEAWWRACREGDVYTIRERAGDA